MKKSMLLVLGIAVLLAVPQAGAESGQTVSPTNQPTVSREIPRGPDMIIDQTPNQANGLFSDLGCDICGTGIQIVADNFVVSTGGFGFNMDEIFLWGGFYPGNTPVGSPYEIRVHADNAGAPDPAAICSASAVVPTSDTLTGVVLFGVDEHEFQFTIPPCYLADGTYWLSVFTDTGIGEDDFFWELGDLDGTGGVLGSAWSPTNPPTPWNLDPGSEAAFQITGTTVPVELQSFDIE